MEAEAQAAQAGLEFYSVAEDDLVRLILPPLSPKCWNWV